MVDLVLPGRGQSSWRLVLWNSHHRKKKFRKLLSFVSEHEASDLHLKVGYPPFVRIGGHLRKLQLPELPDTSYIDGMFKSLVPHDRWRDFENKGSVDFSTAHSTGDRFRINLFRSRGEIHAAIRRVQAKILDFNDLHLPDVYRKLITESSEGLSLGVWRDRQWKKFDLGRHVGTH